MEDLVKAKSSKRKDSPDIIFFRVHPDSIATVRSCQISIGIMFSENQNSQDDLNSLKKVFDKKIDKILEMSKKMDPNGKTPKMSVEKD